MKKEFKKIVMFLPALVLILGCEKAYDDRAYDTDLNEDQAFETFDRVMRLGYNVYNYVPDGFNSIDGSFRAGATDDGEHSSNVSAVRLFNDGTWSEFINPDDNWERMYQGIRSANLFLENSAVIENFLVQDTFTPSDKIRYARNVADVGFLRSEARFLRAYYYFELIKRYGGVPLING